MAFIALISFFIAAHLLFLKYGVFFISLSIGFSEPMGVS